ncbi:MAG: electron transfer flavoprotein subunit beta/FixA family protein [Chloroflexota bacterium]|nr:electron transfer flavoprotein subunit beta/FixA family protein [Chloroflexota bacterium]
MALAIAVLIKQVPDMGAVKIDRSTGKPTMSGQNVVSSFDEYAIEAAIQLRDANEGEVTVVCAGPASAKDAVTRALAMGADCGMHLLIERPNELDTLEMAGILSESLKGTEFDLILTGQNSDDYTTGHVGPQVAELLGLPHISSVTKIEIEGRQLALHRDTEDGVQHVDVTMPALVMAMTGLNTPRYPSIKGMMAAKKKPVEQTTSVNAERASERISWGEPIVPERIVSGTVLQDKPPAEAAQALVAWLKENRLI